MRHYSQKPRSSLIMRWMTSNKWTRWSSTRRLSQSETSNLMRISVLNPNGLKNRRNSTSWWKLKDLRSFKKRRREKSEKCMLESKELRSSLTRSRREPSREWRSKKFVIRKRSNSKPTSKKWEKKTRQLTKPKELKWIFLWSRQLRLMLRLSLKNKEESKRKKILTTRLLIIRGKRTRKNSRPNKKLRDWEKKKSAKSKDLESFKKRLPIDKLKLIGN